MSWTAVAFVAPAVVVLGVWLVFPLVSTFVRSFFDATGAEFVGLENYGDLLGRDSVLTALRNNALWVGVVPAALTAIGLVFAVLAERVRWAVAFKIVVFMPMAISLFAAGVIWRIMDVQDPEQGAVNATIGVVRDAFSPEGVLSTAQPSTETVTGSLEAGFESTSQVSAGQTVTIGLTGIETGEMPADARQADPAQPTDGAVTGTVWRDFRPGGGEPGVIEAQEQGIPGITIELLDSQRDVVKTTTSDRAGVFVFSDVAAGDYRVRVGPQSFETPFAGVPWLGPKLIIPSMMVAYIWVWAGFAMVLIAAGLSAISREVQEAARIDGANEWQVFRHITAPMLRPVLAVVLVTLAINVLKVFDIVLSVAPGSSQDDATVIALEMWRVSFGGENNFGLGSAIGILLFVLVAPVLLLNVRRLRRDQT
jgi:alpha-glucoside transport system permease protein